MKKLLQLGKSYPVNAALIVLLLALSIWYFGSSFVDGISSAFTQAEVTETTRQAEAEKSAARDELREAGAESVNRQIEDSVRTRTIEPEIERTSQASSNARERSQRSSKTYEQSQKSFRRDGLDDGALHDRNCANLHELYPGEIFRDCERE